MIGKLIGAAAGSQAAKYTKSLGGTGGALLGAVAVPFVSRLRLPALLALGVGGYAIKKLADRSKVQRELPAPRSTYDSITD